MATVTALLRGFYIAAGSFYEEKPELKPTVSSKNETVTALEIFETLHKALIKFSTHVVNSLHKCLFLQFL